MDLKQYLPSFYLESAEVVNLQDGLSVIDTELKADIEDLKNQLFVSTCTWAIDLWEKYVGLEVAKNEPLNSRKSAVIAALSGQGTATKELIISICEKFSNSKVEIIENPQDYSFIIKFTSIRGIIKNLNALSSKIDKLKPAYLGYTYEFLFNTHDFIQGYTHEYLSTLTHDMVQDFY